MAGWLQTHVVENYSWHAKLCSLRVQLPGFEFIAGQFVRLAVETAEGRMQRAYSLVNAPGDPQLDFLLTPVADGKVSPRFARVASRGYSLGQPACHRLFYPK